MHSLRLIWFFLLLTILTNSSHAQIVYGIGAGGHRPITIVRQDEHIWVIKTQSGWYGLFQFSDRTGADAPWVRRTSIYLGRELFRVRLPAVAVAGITLVAVASAVLLSVSLTGKTRRVH